MIKAVLFDADGVVIKSRGKYFSQRLAEKQDLPLEIIMAFFKSDYQLCATGKADLREVLPKYYSSWKWQGSTDDLLRFWFEAEKDLDEGVMAIVNSVRSRGVRVALVTDNEEYRGKYLLEEIGLGQRFDDVFLSCRMGVRKSSPDFFTQILKQTGLKPEEILYWDDEQKNLDVAAQLGFNGKLFINTKEMMLELDAIFGKI